MNSLVFFLIALIGMAVYVICRLAISVSSLKEAAEGKTGEDSPEEPVPFEFLDTPVVHKGDLFVIVPDDPFKDRIYVVVTAFAAGENGKTYVRYAYSDRNGRYEDDKGFHGNSDEIGNFMRRCKFVRNVKKGL